MIWITTYLVDVLPSFYNTRSKTKQFGNLSVQGHPWNTSKVTKCEILYNIVRKDQPTVRCRKDIVQHLAGDISMADYDKNHENNSVESHPVRLTHKWMGELDSIIHRTLILELQPKGVWGVEPVESTINKYDKFKEVCLSLSKTVKGCLMQQGQVRLLVILRGKT